MPFHPFPQTSAQLLAPVTSEIKVENEEKEDQVAEAECRKRNSETKAKKRIKKTGGVSRNEKQNKPSFRYSLLKEDTLLSLSFAKICCHLTSWVATTPLNFI